MISIVAFYMIDVYKRQLPGCARRHALQRRGYTAHRPRSPRRLYRPVSYTHLDVYKRQDMYYADLGRGIGSEQEGYRPVVIIQNNTGNKYSPTVIVAAISRCV